MILGDDDFVSRVRSEYLEGGSLSEQPIYREMVSEKIASDKVLECAARALGLDIGRVRVRSGSSVERGIIAELLYRYGGITQREIGHLLGGVGYTTVSMMRRHLSEMMEQNEDVKAQYTKAEKSVRRLIED